MKRVRMFTVCGVLALGLAITGCSSVQKGAAAGGAIGAAAGALYGHNASAVSTGGGALMGGAAGAATGGLAGDAYAQVTQDDIEREIENLRAELLSKDAELAALRDSGLTGEALAQFEATKSDLQNALSDLENTRADRDRLDGELGSLRASLNAKDSDISRLNGELANLRSAAGARDAEVSALNERLTKTLGDRDEALARADEMRRRLSDAETALANARAQADVIQASLREKQNDVENLRRQMENLNVQLEETSRGLQLTIVDELLFKPGKAELSTSGGELLGRIATIVESNFPGRELLIEGHTDNQPITKSGWRSNWELGAARALTVLHELMDNHGFDPSLLSATTFGEHRPAATNATLDGRAGNRRSVIVILPEKMPLQRNQFAKL